MNLQDLIAKTTPGEWVSAGNLIVGLHGQSVAICGPEHNRALIIHMHKTYMEIVEALQAIESHQQTTIEPTAEGFQAIARMALTKANTIL